MLKYGEIAVPVVDTMQVLAETGVQIGLDKKRTNPIS